MTTPPTPVAARHRSPWWGVAVTVTGWLLLAFPAFIVFLLAGVSFSGCFLECGPPETGDGTALVVILVAMIALPPLVGMAIVRDSRRWWQATGLTFLAAVGAFLLAAR